jgi:hypothetical protein
MLSLTHFNTYAKDEEGVRMDTHQARDRWMAFALGGFLTIVILTIIF